MQKYWLSEGTESKVLRLNRFCSLRSNVFLLESPWSITLTFLLNERINERVYQIQAQGPKVSGPLPWPSPAKCYSNEHVLTQRRLTMTKKTHKMTTRRQKKAKKKNKKATKRCKTAANRHKKTMTMKMVKTATKILKVTIKRCKATSRTLKMTTK